MSLPILLIYAAAVCLRAASSGLASVRDARVREIPNGCCVAIALAAVLIACARAEADAAPRLVASPLCLAFGVGVLLVGVVIELAFRAVAGRAGLGLGDVKYVAAWAAVLGPASVFALAVACFAGAMFALVRGERTFAFAPWLTGAFALALVWALAL